MADKDVRRQAMTKVAMIRAHQADLSSCRLCPEMVPPVIIGTAVASDILLVGQAGKSHLAVIIAHTFTAHRPAIGVG